MVEKRTSRRQQDNILTNNAITRSADSLGKQVGEVGKGVEKIGEEAEKLLRPFQRTMAFATGVLRGGLQGMAKWGRRAAMAGLFLGIGAMVMTAGGITLPAFLGGGYFIGGWSMAGAMLPAMGWAAGLIGGSLVGGAIGALKGGPERLALEERKAKYADELAIQNAARPRGKNRGPQLDKAAYREYKEDVSDGNFDRFQQRFDLAAEDTSQSWADRVSGSPSGELGR